jgi:cystathionine gamma-lyase
MKISTKVIHAGQKPDPTTGAIMTPVYLTSTYVQEAPGVHKGYDYARTINPTRSALEANLAAIENGRFGLAFSSGCAAINTVLNLIKTGDHVISSRDIYGGTYRLFIHVYKKYGLNFSFVDTSNIKEIERAIRPNTRLIWIETPSNPMLTITDIAQVSKLASAHNILVACDNTFASPYLQEPLKLGAHIVVHSTTKYLGGHSDLIGGAIVVNDEAIYKELKFYQNAVGAVPGALDCFLVLRGIKTLVLRMERHCANAKMIAGFLKEHDEVARVYYPGLPEHPGHEVADKQMRDFGGMISFELVGGASRAAKFCSSTKIFSLAESLGGVESLVTHVASMTHEIIPESERALSGVSEKVIRLSVGIEDCDDLLEDISQAIKASRDY